jgi:hypothetical protein
VSTLSSAITALAELGLASPPSVPPTTTAPAAPHLPVVSGASSSSSTSSTAATTSPPAQGKDAAKESAEASGYAPIRVVVSADSLFPIVVWVVIHANLTHVHVALGHLERFLAEDQRNFGEAGMCLSLMEAAVMGVRGMTPDKYGLSPDIENEFARQVQREQEAKARAQEAEFDERQQKLKKEKAAAKEKASAAASTKTTTTGSATPPLSSTPPTASASILNADTTASATAANSMDSFAALVKQASNAMTVTTGTAPLAPASAASATAAAAANPFANSENKPITSGGAGPSGGSGPSGGNIVPPIVQPTRKFSVDSSAGPTTPNGSRVRRTQSVSGVAPAGAVSRQLQQRAKLAETLDTIL